MKILKLSDYAVGVFTEMVSYIAPDAKPSYSLSHLCPNQRVRSPASQSAGVAYSVSGGAAKSVN
jgi:hypothetical protein